MPKKIKISPKGTNALQSKRVKDGISLAQEMTGLAPGRPPKMTPEIWNKAIELIKDEPRLSPRTLSVQINDWLAAQGRKETISAATVYLYMPRLRKAQRYPRNLQKIFNYYRDK